MSEAGFCVILPFMEPNTRRTLVNTLWFAVCCAVGLAADLGSKSWIFERLGHPPRDRIVIIPNWFSLTTALNEGALFSIGQGFALGFAALSFVAMAGIGYWLWIRGGIADRRMAIILGFILAGITGNLYDRLGLPGLKWSFPPERAGQHVFAVRDWLLFRIEHEVIVFEPILQREIPKQEILFDWPVFNLADVMLVVGAASLFLLSFWPEPKKPE
ncbi:MAG: signal peptidase II [Pirellulales bacterium]|nr:signal peptidase II [Pirellulales bacterium]